MSTSSQGTQPLLVRKTEISLVAGIAAGSSVTRYATTNTISTAILSDIDGSDSGTLTAKMNGTDIGSKLFTLVIGETGTFDDLIVTSKEI